MKVKKKTVDSEYTTIRIDEKTAFDVERTAARWGVELELLVGFVCAYAWDHFGRHVPIQLVNDPLPYVPWRREVRTFPARRADVDRIKKVAKAVGLSFTEVFDESFAALRNGNIFKGRLPSERHLHNLHVVMRAGRKRAS